MANYRELSTFERWASEVTTAQLKWGSKLVHCEKFWRENAALLEQHDFKLLKELVALLVSLEAEVVREKPMLHMSFEMYELLAE